MRFYIDWNFKREYIWQKRRKYYNL